ncbi:type II secretion system F family protein [Verrucomicrobiaceae bacterium 5K15]|uniref:Type II secretion system F family protein n=1 Tax=Oceaniferula flava TaxID=2800421 RepID=A0AAE2SCW4_9BACT|nr:type II secretion system F family protein [Oceaniferula flavus]MBK1854687.1 type II secretion system F family protein [Oceaniferula flavus]MBM1135993.1 type II secretion system F family protein [Oceaniferula flavus]
MAVFTYKALAKDGAVSTGEITAGDRTEAIKVLSRRGLQPVNLSASSVAKPSPKAKKNDSSKATKESPPVKGEKPPEKEGKGPARDANGLLKLKRAEVVMFTEELSEMLGAGLQLEPALKSMENREELGSLKDVSRDIRQLVRDGSSFSLALRKVSDSFGPLYCSLAAAGEASGALDTILKRQAHYLKTLQELQSKVTLALIYPAFLVLAGIGVGVIFVTKLIPQLTDLISSTPGGKIPLGAKILINTSNFFQQWWLVMLLTLVGGALIFKAWKDAESNRLTWDRTKLKLPLLGAVIESRFYVQFLETLANLVGNGLPLLRSLELSRDATQNLHIRGHMDRVIEMVGDGRSFSRSLISTGIFPPLLIDMVSVGEKTGKLDKSLRRAAERYDSELNKSLSRVMELIMPVVLVVMALLIGTMAYLMITAIFQTIDNLGGR